MREQPDNGGKLAAIRLANKCGSARLERFLRAVIPGSSGEEYQWDLRRFRLHDLQGNAPIELRETAI